MKTCLHYKEGSSDKVYQIEMLPMNGLFVVNFAFGRRGSTLNTGSKTPSPVDEATARKVFDQVVREKKAKGYTEAENGTPYAQSDKAGQISGLVPQLLNPIDAADVERYIRDNDWCLQEKKDGVRLLIQKEGATIRGVNRRGLFVNVAEPIIKAFENVPGDLIIDGEAIGESYHAFDLLLAGSRTMALRPYGERVEGLRQMLMTIACHRVGLVPISSGTEAKQSAFDRLLSQGAEGVVFKMLSAGYSPGRPHTGGPALKFKFTASVSCIVAEVSTTKRSVTVALHDNGRLRTVGNVTIPPNRPKPKAGEVVEVRYLYAFPNGGALFQPVYQSRRDDIEPEDCTIDQLKYKGPNGDEVDGQ